MAFEGLGVLAQGLLGGMQAAGQQNLAEATLEARRYQMARQLQDEQRKQVADAVKMIDTDPQGAIDVINSLPIEANTKVGLLTRAQRNVDLMGRAQRLQTKALQGSLAEEDFDPEALRFVKDPKAIQDAITQLREQGMGRFWGIETQGITDPEELRIATPKILSRYPGKGDIYDWYSRRLAAVAPGGLPSPTEQRARSNQKEIEDAVNYYTRFGGDPKRIAGFLQARGVGIDLLDRIAPQLKAQGDALRTYMETGAREAAQVDILGTPVGGRLPMPAIGPEGEFQVPGPLPEIEPRPSLPGRPMTRGALRAQQAGEQAEATAAGTYRGPLLMQDVPNPQALQAESFGATEYRREAAKGQAGALPTAALRESQIRLNDARTLLNQVQANEKDIKEAATVVKMLSDATMTHYIATALPPEEKQQVMRDLETARELARQAMKRRSTTPRPALPGVGATPGARVPTGAGNDPLGIR